MTLARAPEGARRAQHPVEALVIVEMRHGVDLLLVVGEADGDDGLARAQVAQRAVVVAAAVAEPPARGDRRPAAAPAGCRARAPACRPWARRCPTRPCPWRRPASRRGRRAAGPCPASPAAPARSPRRASRRSSGQTRNSSGSEEKPETTAPSLRRSRRNPSPCAATASAARACASAPRPARHAFMRARSAFFASRMSDVSFTPRHRGKSGGRGASPRKYAEPPEPFERRSRVVPTRCRWAPCIRDHGLGQGQLPCEFL